jgi:hypothetical protein
VIRLVTSATTRKTPSLPASSRIRSGTAVSEERIAPVEYSLVTTSTPSTAIASWPSPSPERLVATGSKWARSLADALGQAWLVPQLARIPMPMVRTITASSVQPVERTERSFVHSECSTLGRVAPAPAEPPDSREGAVATAAVMTAPPA